MGKVFAAVLILFAMMAMTATVSHAQAKNSIKWSDPPNEFIAEIKNSSGVTEGVGLLSGEPANTVIKLFNQTISGKVYNQFIGRKTLPGKITYCRRVIDISVGVVDGDHSYGGLCLLKMPSKKPIKVMVCADTLVGHFKIGTLRVGDSHYLGNAPYVESTLKIGGDDVFDLSKFVANNCTGG